MCLKLEYSVRYCQYDIGNILLVNSLLPLMRYVLNLHAAKVTAWPFHTAVWLVLYFKFRSFDHSDLSIRVDAYQ